MVIEPLRSQSDQQLAATCPRLCYYSSLGCPPAVAKYTGNAPLIGIGAGQGSVPCGPSAQTPTSVPAKIVRGRPDAVCVPHEVRLALRGRTLAAACCTTPVRREGRLDMAGLRNAHIDRQRAHLERRSGSAPLPTPPLVSALSNLVFICCCAPMTASIHSPVLLRASPRVRRTASATTVRTRTGLFRP